MFDFLFGWSKASNCKKVIKRARCRLKLLKNKRLVTARQLRQDLAELIKNGHQHVAANRVEQVIKDESLAAAYELLDYFCEFILTQLSYIKRHKDCPNDINEAVSSLIFASARCGDVPELCAIRKLFRQRYGNKFATTAVELFPGNLVNRQLKENLSVNCVPEDLKCRVMDEIARDYCRQPKHLAIEYYPDWQQVQVKQNKDASIIDTIAGSKRNVICVNSSARSFLSKPNDSCSLRGSSTITNASGMISSDQQCPPYILSSPLQKNLEKIEKFDELNSITASGLEEVDYVDNSEVSKREPERRTRRRSASFEKQGIMDIGCLLYYQKSYRSLSADKGNAHYSRKHQKLLLEEIPKSCYAQKRLKKHGSSEGTKRRTYLNHKTSGCSLDRPCYFCAYDDNLCLGGLPMNPKRGIIARNVQHKVLLVECCHWNEELYEPQRPDRKSDNGAALYNVFTYLDCQIDGQNETKPSASESMSRFASSDVAESCKYNMLRTYSCLPHPNHVHPMFPDYDDLAAKFTALKRERLRNKKDKN